MALAAPTTSSTGSTTVSHGNAIFLLFSGRYYCFQGQGVQLAFIFIFFSLNQPYYRHVGKNVYETTASSPSFGIANQQAPIT